MTLKIELDGWLQPYEYRALAGMFTTLAEGREADREDRGFAVKSADAAIKSAIVSDARFSGSVGDETITASPEFVKAYKQAAEELDAIRERGKPSGDRARRTKVEMAEDEEIEKLAEQAQVPLAELDKALAKHSRSEVLEGLTARIAKLDAAGPAQISTGEERVGPEDDAETAEKDAEDEKAEVEATRSVKAQLTVDDVKAAVSKYVEKHGIPCTQEDGPQIFLDALGAPPAGEAGWKMSILPDNQEDLQKCVDAWLKAAAAPERYKAA